jgi:hypothetical protein
MSNHVTIKRVSFHVWLPTADEAADMQERVKDLFYSRLLSALEHLFARYNSDDIWWRIDTLHIDIGQINANFSDEDVCGRIVAAIADYLEQLLRNGNTDMPWWTDNNTQANSYAYGYDQEPPDSGKPWWATADSNTADGHTIRRKASAHQARAAAIAPLSAHDLALQSFAYFLQYGVLPWYYQGTLTDLQQQIANNIPEAAALLWHLPTTSTDLKHYTRRLAQQFDAPTVDALLAIFYSHQTALIAQWQRYFAPYWRHRLSATAFAAKWREAQLLVALVYRRLDASPPILLRQIVAALAQALAMTLDEWLETLYAQTNPAAAEISPTSALNEVAAATELAETSSDEAIMQLRFGTPADKIASKPTVDLTEDNYDESVQGERQLPITASTSKKIDFDTEESAWTDILGELYHHVGQQKDLFADQQILTQNIATWLNKVRTALSPPRWKPDFSRVEGLLTELSLALTQLLQSYAAEWSPQITILKTTDDNAISTEQLLADSHQSPDKTPLTDQQRDEIKAMLQWAIVWQNVLQTALTDTSTQQAVVNIPYYYTVVQTFGQNIPTAANLLEAYKPINIDQQTNLSAVIAQLAEITRDIGQKTAQLSQSAAYTRLANLPQLLEQWREMSPASALQPLEQALERNYFAPTDLEPLQHWIRAWTDKKMQLSNDADWLNVQLYELSVLTRQWLRVTEALAVLGEWNIADMPIDTHLAADDRQDDLQLQIERLTKTIAEGRATDADSMEYRNLQMQYLRQMGAALYSYLRALAAIWSQSVQLLAQIGEMPAGKVYWYDGDKENKYPAAAEPLPTADKDLLQDLLAQTKAMALEISILAQRDTHSRIADALEQMLIIATDIQEHLIPIAQLPPDEPRQPLAAAALNLAQSLQNALSRLAKKLRIAALQHQINRNLPIIAAAAHLDKDDSAAITSSDTINTTLNLDTPIISVESQEHTPTNNIADLPVVPMTAPAANIFAPDKPVLSDNITLNIGLPEFIANLDESFANLMQLLSGLGTTDDTEIEPKLEENDVLSDAIGADSDRVGEDVLLPPPTVGEKDLTAIAETTRDGEGHEDNVSAWGDVDADLLAAAQSLIDGGDMNQEEKSTNEPLLLSADSPNTYPILTGNTDISINIPILSLDRVGEDNNGTDNTEKVDDSDISSEYYELSNTDKPSNTDLPSNTDKPLISDKQIEADKPILSDELSNTDKPSNTDLPSNTDKPLISDKQIDADKSILSDELNNTDKPSNIDLPSNTDKPLISDKQIEADKSILSDELSNTDKPSNTDLPSNTDKPLISDKQIEADKSILSDELSNTDKPSNTDLPSNTDKPLISDKQIEADKSILSDELSNTDKPSNIDLPSNTDKPLISDKQIEADKSILSDELSNTDKPSNTDLPNNTDKPIISDKQIEADKSILSDELSNTDKPSNTDLPSNTDKPLISDKQIEADKPILSDELSNTDKPSNTDLPNNTDKPIISDKQIEADKSILSDELSNTDKPSNTDLPSNTDKPLISDKQIEADKSILSDELSNTDKPSNTDLPSNTDKPIISDKQIEADKSILSDELSNTDKPSNTDLPSNTDKLSIREEESDTDIESGYAEQDTFSNWSVFQDVQAELAQDAIAEDNITVADEMGVVVQGDDIIQIGDIDIPSDQIRELPPPPQAIDDKGLILAEQASERGRVGEDEEERYRQYRKRMSQKNDFKRQWDDYLTALQSGDQSVYGASEPTIVPYRLPKESQSEEWYIDNAGLILLWVYLGYFFRDLQLIDKGKFADDAAQQRAVHLLQYVATKQENAEEPLLLLNKILCGMPYDEPIEREVALTDKEKEACNKLISSAIKNWSALKNTSIEGYREAFIQREGKLTYTEEGWKLLVTPKTYDILINYLPYGISLIRQAWMTDNLWVEWV